MHFGQYNLTMDSPGTSDSPMKFTNAIIIMKIPLRKSLNYGKTWKMSAWEVFFCSCLNSNRQKKACLTDIFGCGSKTNFQRLSTVHRLVMLVQIYFRTIPICFFTKIVLWFSVCLSLSKLFHLAYVNLNIPFAFLCLLNDYMFATQW